MPSIHDGAAFFVNVLLDNKFQQDGVLFGSEYLPADAEWAAIDPRRHKLYIWEKDGEDFLDGAMALGASVITNGAFHLYTSGDKDTATRRFAISAAADAFLRRGTIGKVLSLFMPERPKPSANDGPLSSLLIDIWPEQPESLIDRNALLYFQTHVAEGYIIGNHENIRETSESRPNASYFGRRNSRQFQDYEVGDGDPPSTMAEVIGGLHRSVRNYSPVDPDWQNPQSYTGVGHWGLAPLTLGDAELSEAGIGAALDEFHGKQQGEQQLPPLTGLLFTMAYRGRVRPDLLIGNRVRDAVRHDGNSSTLLGYDSTMVFGVPMIVAKRNGQRWGFQCQAE